MIATSEKVLATVRKLKRSARLWLEELVFWFACVFSFGGYWAGARAPSCKVAASALSGSWRLRHRT